jgi:hypothetical protein
MSNEKRFVCTECSYVVHPATYCSQCPRCAGDLRPARQELRADRKLPTYRSADAD